MIDPEVMAREIQASVPLPEQPAAGMRLWQERCGGPGTRIVHHRVGLGEIACTETWIDGEHIPHCSWPSYPSPRTIDWLRVELYQRYGLAWSQVTLTVQGDGQVSWHIDWDGAPDVPMPNPRSANYVTRRLVADNAFRDLRRYPRPPERVPVWVKATLASQGGWDIDHDVPTCTYDLANDPAEQYTGTPVPYEQAYQVLHAKNPSVLPHALDPNRPLDPTPQPTIPPEPTPPPPPPWPASTDPLDPAPYRALAYRWQQLAEDYPHLVTLLPAPTPDQLAWIAHAATAALPGARIGPHLTLSWAPSTPTPGQTLYHDQDVHIAAPLTPTGDLTTLTAATRDSYDIPFPLNHTVLDW